ncbi:unnamed protein product, partial [Protopolystoma xenopodis]
MSHDSLSVYHNRKKPVEAVFNKDESVHSSPRLAGSNVPQRRSSSSSRRKRSQPRRPLKSVSPLVVASECSKPTHALVESSNLLAPEVDGSDSFSAALITSQSDTDLRPSSALQHSNSAFAFADSLQHSGELNNFAPSDPVISSGPDNSQSITGSTLSGVVSDDQNKVDQITHMPNTASTNIAVQSSKDVSSSLMEASDTFDCTYSNTTKAPTVHFDNTPLSEAVKRPSGLDLSTDTIDFSANRSMAYVEHTSDRLDAPEFEACTTASGDHSLSSPASAVMFQPNPKDESTSTEATTHTLHFSTEVPKTPEPDSIDAVDPPVLLASAEISNSRINMNIDSDANASIDIDVDLGANYLIGCSNRQMDQPLFHLAKVLNLETAASAGDLIRKYRGWECVELACWRNHLASAKDIETPLQAGLDLNTKNEHISMSPEVPLAQVAEGIFLFDRVIHLTVCRHLRGDDPEPTYELAVGSESLPLLNCESAELLQANEHTDLKEAGKCLKAEKMLGDQETIKEEEQETKEEIEMKEMKPELEDETIMKELEIGEGKDIQEESKEESKINCGKEEKENLEIEADETSLVDKGNNCPLKIDEFSECKSSLNLLLSTHSSSQAACMSDHLSLSSPDRANTLEMSENVVSTVEKVFENIPATSEEPFSQKAVANTGRILEECKLENVTEVENAFPDACIHVNPDLLAIRKEIANSDPVDNSCILDCSSNPDNHVGISDVLRIDKDATSGCDFPTGAVQTLAETTDLPCVSTCSLVVNGNVELPEHCDEPDDGDSHTVTHEFKAASSSVIGTPSIEEISTDVSFPSRAVTVADNQPGISNTESDRCLISQFIYIKAKETETDGTNDTKLMEARTEQLAHNEATSPSSEFKSTSSKQSFEKPVVFDELKPGKRRKRIFNEDRGVTSKVAVAIKRSHNERRLMKMESATGSDDSNMPSFKDLFDQALNDILLAEAACGKRPHAELSPLEAGIFASIVS